MKISVLMATYNHEAFITQAIESVLIQYCDFEIELLIGEDCSTDKTRSIIEKYAKSFPSIIKPVYHDKNVGAARNFQQLYNMATGDYLAELEGDDYWTDPLKLLKQVMFMEKNRECTMSFHNVLVFEQEGTAKVYPFHQPHTLEPRYALANILRGNFMQSCSIVYRKGVVPQSPDWILDLPMGDWPLHLLHAEHGYIGYIDEIMAVYRRHNSSSWSSNAFSELTRRSITTTWKINEALNGKYQEAFRYTIAHFYQNLVNSLWNEKKIDSAVDAVYEALEVLPENRYHLTYLDDYTKVITSQIVHLIESGNVEKAITIFDKAGNKFDNINGFGEIRTLMDKLKSMRRNNIKH